MYSSNISQPSCYLNGEQANVKFGNSTTDVVKSTSIQFELLPNPSNGQVFLFIQDEAPLVTLNMYDVQVILVYGNTEVSSGENVPLPSLWAGVYIVKILGEGGEITKKWQGIKQLVLTILVA